MLRTCSYARALLLALFVLPLTHITVFAGGAAPQSPGPIEDAITVSGAITDASGGVLAGATVEAIVATRVAGTATTGGDGRYALRTPAGVPFELRVRRSGFADRVMHLRGGDEPLVQDLTLQIGAVADTLVVTPTRGAESRATVTSAVTVATREDIQALGAAQLSDVLRFVPGVAVEANGREGGQTALFARGGESDYNLVLIDGVRVNLQGGNFDFSRIDAREIERVEVVRGAQSSLWGSDAMGSVVQIITRRAGVDEAPRVSGSVEGGSHGTVRGDARVSGGARRALDYQAGATFRRTDGAFADILPEDDWYEQTGFAGGVGLVLGTRATLRTGLRYSHAQGRSVSFLTYGARDVGGQYDTKSLSWHTDLSHALGARYTGTGTVNYFRYEGRSGDGVADPPFTTYAILEGTPGALYPGGVRLVRLIDQVEFDALSAAGAQPAPGQFLASATNFGFTFDSLAQLRRPAIRYQGDVALGAGARLSVGYEWERESIPSLASSPRTTGFGLDNHAFFVQQQAAFAGRLFVTVGARVDSRESYDTYVSPKLSLGGFLVPVRPGPVSSVKVFGNVGRGIKSPGFSERFGSAFGDPNPALEVERARTGDAGIEATFASERLRGLVTYFHNDYLDQIAYRPGPVGDGIPESINIDGSRARGWELEVALQRPARGFTAGATYAFVDTEVVTNRSTSQEFQPGQPLLRRPKHSGTIRAAFAAGRVTFHGDVRMVGDRHDNSFLFLFTVPNAQYPSPFTTDITVNPGYTVAGAGLDYRVDRTISLYIRGNNVTDTAYDSALGFPGMPRTVMVGVRVDR